VIGDNRGRTEEGAVSLIQAQIVDLTRDQLPSAADLVACAMRDNPLHVAAFGNDPQRRLRRLEALFRAYLPAMRRPPLGAYHAGTLVGVLGLAPPGACRPSVSDGLRVLASAFSAGPAVSVRAARWFAAYERRDPRERHWHLGPVAVHPGQQGIGIGSLMLRGFCALVDAAGDTAYLETDKAENVRLYRRFDFEVVGEATILRTCNWFMRRPPAR
jgi:ribosomal protein S18 acetylase RimI-like enzyme